MNDQINRTQSTSSRVSTTTPQSSAASTAHKVGAWTYYALFGFWIRVVVAVFLVGCGAALLVAGPIAVLERAGVLLTHMVTFGPWLGPVSDGIFYLLAAAASVVGAFLLYLAFGPARRWLLHHPAA
jgi:hypothetical protein